MSDWLRPVLPLVFTAEARRLLAVVLLSEGDERVMPGDEKGTAIAGALADLGLLELKAGGYVATDFLRAQPWADDLRNRPFPDDLENA